ncbi:type IV toxin-antitoxin system AbiEi family antitoxin [Tamlana sp. I1]|uniref:type IV toxin-antitoxin system AbiEi family antitoxin domain-containing protein n=1 Tax=Tamlana sp. I1 TaxID=2762061 RepID=UPI00188DCA3D|nr:type IV toxin-antitoxin system AbiEi family antitoxin [Tamlana sp. I1]
MYLSDFIKERLSHEEYSFSKDELHLITKKEKSKLTTDLSYLVKKGEIISLRKGFYLIIPPRYSKFGKLPLELYVDKLFKFIGRPYYVGLYSAAKFHGASHQQIQREYIVTIKPTVLDITKKGNDIHFFTSSKWPSKNIIEKKSDAGIFKISSPALTAVDLIHHQNKLGGINRMLAILEELFEELTKNDIDELLSWYPHKSTLQRFGFLLEELQVEEHLLKPIMQHLKTSKYFPVLLSPKKKQKAGGVDNDWKVDVNIKLESDL